MKSSGVTILQGVEFSIFPIDFEWALQQCSATALPVMVPWAQPSQTSLKRHLDRFSCFAGLTTHTDTRTHTHTHRQTYRSRYSVCSKRPLSLANAAMRPNNNNNNNNNNNKAVNSYRSFGVSKVDTQLLHCLNDGH